MASSSRKQNRSPFTLAPSAGREHQTPGLAESLRKATRGCAPVSPGCARRRGAEQGRAYHITRATQPLWTRGPPALRAAVSGLGAASSHGPQLPGGGAAHRASIRDRRRGREEGQEEEAGFKRKAVTPHKRFL